MKIVLRTPEVILGYAEASEARTDPPMGCGEVTLFTTDAYSCVADLFRQKTLNSGILGPRDEAKICIADESLSTFHLSLEMEDGAPISVAGFTVSDYREELPDEPLTLEFYGMHYKHFSILFPGHYESYEQAFRKV